MTKTLLEKMFVKSDYKRAVLHAPEELNSSLVINNTSTELDSSYEFILSFYVKKKDLENEVSKMKNALLPNGLLWIAYPKGKSLQTDLNRDILHSLMEEHGLDGVSLVSLNETWSAMRFKRV